MWQSRSGGGGGGGGRIGVLQQASNQGYITEKHKDVVNKCYMQRKNRMAELIPEKQ